MEAVAEFLIWQVGRRFCRGRGQPGRRALLRKTCGKGQADRSTEREIRSGCSRMGRHEALLVIERVGSREAPRDRLPKMVEGLTPRSRPRFDTRTKRRPKKAGADKPNGRQCKIGSQMGTATLRLSR